jgi:xylulokinase
MYSIGLDVGTTGVKALVCDIDGKILGSGFHEYNVICDAPGMAEQDPEMVWHYTKEVLSSVISQCDKRQDIRTLSLSVQGDAIIPVDKDLHPLYHALLGMDYRSEPQSRFFCERLGDKFLFQKTGMRPHPMNSAAKILWFVQEKPEIMTKIWKFMTYEDYILCKLGADEPVIDYTMSSRTMLFSLETCDWSNSILEAMNLDRSLLSGPVPSGTPAGTLNRVIASALGLTGTVTLVTGGHDQTCAALGAGLTQENIAVDSHGTAEVIGTAFNEKRTNDTMFESYYPCYCHVKKDMYFTFSLNHIGGILLQWYRDQFCGEELKESVKSGISPYRLMENKTKPGPSSVLVLPHFNGSGTPWCDLSSKGAFVGLTLSTSRHDITKGIMDSLAYELRINLERMRQAGICISDLRAVGGGANSPL